MQKSLPPGNWLPPAKKSFLEFPEEVKLDTHRILTVVLAGATPDKVVTLTALNLPAHVMEVKLRHMRCAYRVIYILLNDGILVVHAFQKKSTKGIKTSKLDIDVIKTRVKDALYRDQKFTKESNAVKNKDLD